MLDAGYCHRYVDCLCVCVLVMTVSPAKVTKPIETARADSGKSDKPRIGWTPPGEYDWTVKNNGKW